MLLNTLITPIFNHLLADDKVARQQLAAQAGKHAQFDLDGWQLMLAISADGYLIAPQPQASADVIIYLRKADLPLILQNPKRASAYVKLSGDADLANTISNLGQQVRWDAEADLARVLGDIAALRMVQGARSLWQGLQAHQRSAQENLAEFLVEEGRVLPAKLEIEDHHNNIVNLRDDVERLLKRIERLERR